MPRLRVLAGTDSSSLVPITDFVNTAIPQPIVSDVFEGQVVVNVQGFTDPEGRVLDSEYFTRSDRKGITWSIQVQGRFLVPYSADDILFGNTFDRPLKLPWGSSAALAFMKVVDPTLEHDLTSPTKPWALSPLISTMPYFMHERTAGSPSPPSSSRSSLDADVTPRASTFPNDVHQPLPPFPPEKSITDDTSQLHLTEIAISGLSSSSSSSSTSSLASVSSVKSILSNSSRKSKIRTGKYSRSAGQPLNLRTASERRSYFSVPKHRKEVYFGPNDVITMDFCYGFLEFNPSLALRLPGGLSFDLMRYWDGQPVRFVCCERKKQDDDGHEPWGKVFWCVTIELCE